MRCSAAFADTGSNVGYGPAFGFSIRLATALLTEEDHPIGNTNGLNQELVESRNVPVRYPDLILNASTMLVAEVRALETQDERQGRLYPGLTASE